MISGIKTCGHHQERANERDVPIGKPKTCKREGKKIS